MARARNRQKIGSQVNVETKADTAVLAAIAGLSAVALLAGGCAERRDLPAAPEPPARVTWEADIQPLFADHCVACHSGASPAANYDLTTLEGVKSGGLDGTPNAIAGQDDCLLLVKSRSGGSMNAFYGTPDEVALLEKWVIEDSLAVR
jgi:mono/diheme cytochrome c family protein